MRRSDPTTQMPSTKGYTSLLDLAPSLWMWQLALGSVHTTLRIDMSRHRRQVPLVFHLGQPHASFMAQQYTGVGHRWQRGAAQACQAAPQDHIPHSNSRGHRPAREQR